MHAKAMRLLLANGTGNLDDGRAGSGGVVADRVVAASQDEVGLASEAGGDGGAEAGLGGSQLSEGGAGDGDPGSVELATGRGDESVAGGGELNGLAALDGAGGGEGNGRESLDGQSRVALGAADDEGSSQRVDLVKGQGGVKGLGEGRLLLGSADVGVVARLDRQDGAGGGEVVLVGNGRGSTEVGADTDTLEDGRDGDERGRVGRGEGVRALGGGGGTGSGQGAGEEADVRVLVVGDLLEVGVEGVGEASSNKGLLRVVLETLAVEGRLEVLQSQGVVEDVGWTLVSMVSSVNADVGEELTIGDGTLGEGSRGGGGEAGKGRGDSSLGEHYELELSMRAR